MVAGGLTTIVIRRLIHITNNALMFIKFIGMAVKRPHRSISEDAGDKPYHEKPFNHNNITHST